MPSVWITNLPHCLHFSGCSDPLLLCFVERLTFVLLAIRALSVEVSALFEDCLFAFLEGGEEFPTETLGKVSLTLEPYCPGYRLTRSLQQCFPQPVHVVAQARDVSFQQLVVVATLSTYAV